MRHLTSPDPCEKLTNIIFSESSEHAYGAMLWSCSHGVVTKLAGSKAKLTPLDQKGDPVKADVWINFFSPAKKTLKKGIFKQK